jgi:DNA-binding transcriptional LysR family regulator
MQDLNDMLYFAEVVERGGFAAAGRALGIPKSRLSRRVSELESQLGVRLLQRTTRKLSLTDVGEAYLRHCQAMRESAQAAPTPWPRCRPSRAAPAGELPGDPGADRAGRGDAGFSGQLSPRCGWKCW